MLNMLRLVDRSMDGVSTSHVQHIQKPLSVYFITLCSPLSPIFMLLAHPTRGFFSTSTSNRIDEYVQRSMDGDYPRAACNKFRGASGANRDVAVPMKRSIAGDAIVPCDCIVRMYPFSCSQKYADRAHNLLKYKVIR